MMHWIRVVCVAVVIPLTLSYCIYRVVWWFTEERRHR